jgi:hypothetical protein
MARTDSWRVVLERIFTMRWQLVEGQKVAGGQVEPMFLRLNINLIYPILAFRVRVSIALARDQAT